MGIQFLLRSCRFKKLLSKFIVESATITPWVLTKARFVCLGDMCVHLEICAGLFFRHSDVTGPRHYRAYYSQLGAPVLEMGFSDKVLCSICGVWMQYMNCIFINLFYSIAILKLYIIQIYLLKI